ncbi:hypothetical protein BSKO_06782 [Bryopsis sp. KO-2023]|nr:hypothetical protein BSKO_06782 [Bryopsis sp. KO-2023]
MTLREAFLKSLGLEVALENHHHSTADISPPRPFSVYNRSRGRVESAYSFLFAFVSGFAFCKKDLVPGSENSLCYTGFSGVWTQSQLVGVEIQHGL